MPFPRKFTFLDRLLIMLSVPLFLPRVAWKLMRVKQDLNPLNDGVRKLSGRKLSATSSDIRFVDVKNASKQLKVTINDMVTACAGTALKQYFEMKGFKDSKSINIAIPANIRFAHYPTWEAVKFENKFAPFPMTVPLERDLALSMAKVHKVTS
jgi:hypothetical protein